MAHAQDIGRSNTAIPEHPATLADAARHAADLLTGAAIRLRHLAAEQDRVFAELRDLNKTSMQAFGSEGERDALGELWTAIERLTGGAL